ncbi:MAG: hypothetical protein JRN44_03900, partial [Nitrososphaerota archaeon]|nr:hypothetical protein [Nitrososphaerota archaeon]
MSYMRWPFRRTPTPSMNMPQGGDGDNSGQESRASSLLPLSLRQFLLWVGPALMVSIAYMDPGNYGTDLAAGAGYKYALLWAGWLASGMAMLLQYLS